MIFPKNKAILTLQEIAVGVSGHYLFSNTTLAIHPGDRICLVGRNGCGKSTMMKVIAGALRQDHGVRWQDPLIRVAYLSQMPNFDGYTDIESYVRSGLSKDHQDEDYRVHMYLSQLDVDPSKSLSALSGGESRRVDLARVLASDAHLILLDEPTNHLDLPTIEWLENFLGKSECAMVLISHDRTLLSKLTDKTVWIDRGVVRQTQSGFERFEKWSEEVYADETKQISKMDKTLEQETLWLRQGISARRTRDQGRLRRLIELRAQRAQVIKRQGKAKVTETNIQRSGQMVVEMENVDHGYGALELIKDFSFSLMFKDRVGLVGRNGVGKSTLLKIICGQIEPNVGKIKRGTQINAIYFDQKRELPENQTLQEVLCVPGSDRVMVNGQPKHIAGYLRDFLFDGGDSRRVVSTLSGGEKARLLLAKFFANSTNFLILDEPTNDLDVETLEMLQELLSEYEGTILIVSHDRAFLDAVVTSVLYFEGNGVIKEYAGGYTDMINQREMAQKEEMELVAEANKKKMPEKKAKTKLSFQEQKQLERLQQLVEKLNAEIQSLHVVIDDPDGYLKDAQKFNDSLKRLDVAKAELAVAEEEWLTLEMLREELEG
jgi:ATP-binding cassette subfamily F protein uup